jgi:hypothetical protein
MPYKSTLKPRPEWGINHTEIPIPTCNFQRFIQSLPAPFHFISAVIICGWSVIVAVLAHLIDGPVKSSWNIATTALIAALKSWLLCLPPQGRHSMRAVRFLTAISLPQPKNIQQLYINIENDVELSKKVIDLVVPTGHTLRMTPPLTRTRTIQVEHVKCDPIKSRNTTILYLHGG